MSNQALGTVYLQIMNDVIESCQVTFEEDGVNQQTLEDLRSTWQKRLTALHVGQFPWEPAPPPPMMAGPLPTPSQSVPSNAPRGSVPSNTAAASSTPSENASGQVRIKTEPGNESQPPFQTNGLPPNYGNNIAVERAAQNLQQKFGQEAQLQINRLQQQAAMNIPANQSGQRSSIGNQASQMSEKQRADVANYHRMAAAQSQTAMRIPNQQQQQQSPPVANNARTDGAADDVGDWDDFVSQRKQSSNDMQAMDLTIREHLEQTQRDYEGGGLLLPVSQQRRSKPLKSNKSTGDSQFDGVADDEDSKADIKDDLFDDDDDDADAINSDLDDPDDNAIEEEQDEGRPNQVMLCTYDKVQRVKNKWKCTLKDGVLNTGGKDYVFTKANGEFEW